MKYDLVGADTYNVDLLKSPLCKTLDNFDKCEL